MKFLRQNPDIKSISPEAILLNDGELVGAHINYDRGHNYEYYNFSENEWMRCEKLGRIPMPVFYVMYDGFKIPTEISMDSKWYYYKNGSFCVIRAVLLTVT